MIPRYSRPEMAAIWEPQTRFRIWFEIEAHAADAMAELGVIPKEAAKAIWDKAKDATFDVARIDEIERETKHDVIAFLTHLAEIVGPEARFLHQGMTSSDVLDTCLAVQLTRAADLLIADRRHGAGRAEAARLRAQDDADHRPQPRHPRRADHLRPQARQAYAEFARAKERLVAARKESRHLRHLRRRRHLRQHRPARRRVCRQGDGPRPSSRSRPRSSRATATPMYFATLGVVASSIERLAIEIRHLQRTEVLEAEEFFSDGPEGLVGHAAQAQPGADREPHRPRPPGARRCDAGAGERRALARARHLALLGRAHASARTPPSTLDFALRRLAGVIDKLLVYPENMQKNLDRLGGLVHSQRVLLALTQKGASREDAYAAGAAQRHEGLARRRRLPRAPEGRPGSEASISPTPSSRSMFDLGYHLKHVDTIFKRVFGES